MRCIGETVAHVDDNVLCC